MGTPCIVRRRTQVPCNRFATSSTLKSLPLVIFESVFLQSSRSARASDFADSANWALTYRGALLFCDSTGALPFCDEARFSCWDRPQQSNTLQAQAMNTGSQTRIIRFFLMGFSLCDNQAATQR